jgi:hypothetical protein
MRSLLILCRLTIVFIVTLLLQTHLAAAHDGASGRWQGSWTSAATGHSGPLRASITPLPNGDYRAIFAGRFAKVIPFVYPARLSSVPGTPGQYTSSQRLPLLGTYRMTASITSHTFHADFRGRKDAGTFRMSRR